MTQSIVTVQRYTGYTLFITQFIQLQADETFTEVDDIDISVGKDESVTLDDVQPSFIVKSKEVKIEPELVPKKD